MKKKIRQQHWSTPRSPFVPTPETPPALRSGSHHPFQVLDQYWRSPEYGGVCFESRQLKKTTCSRSEGWWSPFCWRVAQLAECDPTKLVNSENISQLQESLFPTPSMAVSLRGVPCSLNANLSPSWRSATRQHVQWFRGGLVFEAHRLVYH